MRLFGSTAPRRSRSLAGFVVGLTLLGLTVTTAAVDPAARPAAAQVPGAQRPNVLFIVTDDQRHGMEALPSTHALFAEQGRRYPNGFVTTPLCCPARASIMTGRYAHNHGIKHNGWYPTISYHDMLQAELQKAGYRTALFGKYLNAWPLADAPPNFDEFAVARSGYEDTTWNVNGTVDTVPGYNAHLIGDFAVNFIQEQGRGTKPWFLMLNPYAPHAPFIPESAYAAAPVSRARATDAALEQDLSDKPGWIRNHGGQWDPDGKSVRRQQLRTLMSIDDLVERVMTALEETGQQDTIAVFTSDNGYLWGEHGYIGKGVPYTEAVRVPFYIRWPGHIAPGSVDRRLAANIDLAPTVLNVLGLPAGERDGRDLFDTTSKRNRMHLEYWCNTRACHRWASTRTKSHQYVEHYDADGNVTFREYYDLRADPSQLRNLLRDGKQSNNPAVAPLSAQLQADRSCQGAACP